MEGRGGGHDIVSPVGLVDEESMGVSGTTVKPLWGMERNGRRAVKVSSFALVIR